MEKLTIDGPKMPIGFLASLWKGFEYVNAHPEILVFPVILDAFLWFGPHLSIVSLTAPISDWMTRSCSAYPLFLMFIDALVQSIKAFNLLSLLSFLPLYPPSVMTEIAPASSPLGPSHVYQVAGWAELALLTAALPLASLLFGSVYWIFTGRGMKPGIASWRDGLVRGVRTAAVALLLCALFLFTVLALGVPLLFLVLKVAEVSAPAGAILAQAVVILGGSTLFWLVLFVMFSVHGTALYGDGVLPSIWNSVNTSRWLYPLSIWIPILLIMLYLLSSTVWSLAPADGWAGAIGILGNAYTGSVVVAASMVYYIDKRRWIEEVKHYLQSRMAGTMPPPAA